MSVLKAIFSLTVVIGSILVSIQSLNDLNKAMNTIANKDKLNRSSCILFAKK